MFVLIDWNEDRTATWLATITINVKSSQSFFMNHINRGYEYKSNSLPKSMEITCYVCFSLFEVIIEPMSIPIPKATEARAKVSW